MGTEGASLTRRGSSFLSLGPATEEAGSALLLSLDAGMVSSKRSLDLSDLGGVRLIRRSEM